MSRKPAGRKKSSPEVVETTVSEGLTRADSESAGNEAGAATEPKKRRLRSASKRKKIEAEEASQSVEISYPTVSDEELGRLLSCSHGSPHSILGAHTLSQGVIVRALRPDAVRVNLLIDGDEPREMMQSHPSGFFELHVADRNEVFPYRLEAHYGDGNVFTQRDPYSFLPTVSEFDLHLFGEGHHEKIYEKLGAHMSEINGIDGVSFAVWAPHARGVSVVGDFNSWDGRLHQMRLLGASGVWEIFVPDLSAGALYKFEIHPARGLPFLKADPYAFYTEVPPATSSVVFERAYSFNDEEWIGKRERSEHQKEPLSIYEAHLGSWRRVAEEENRPLTYREIAAPLADYVTEMGFTHVEFMPLKEHPYGGSWGYQVGNYYAPSARYGTPDDFRYLVDYLHGRGLGVIMDWVPAHFPKDAYALGRFDGFAIYEHADPRQGEHPDWGTYIFNYGRNEVRNFLIANALYWVDEFHIDGLRVDAVASMLYLDYSRDAGQWIPNKYGGRENIEAIELLKELNEIIHARHRGVMMVAEESTAWPGVSRPVYAGGLGFDFKWNMGWMHDTLEYFKKDPVHRLYHHDKLTFGIWYAWSEHFILPFSHDEVVHMKGSLINKMPGDLWQRFANLRALLAYMWAHPGKKLLFMGGEFGQWREWSEERSLDWHLLNENFHRGLHDMVRELNRVYVGNSAFWEGDDTPAGFQWIDASNAPENTIAFLRIAPASGRVIVCVSNFSPVVRRSYRVGLPRPGIYREILNTDAQNFGGSNVLNPAEFEAEEHAFHGQPFSFALTIPPLATIWLEAPDEKREAEQTAEGEVEEALSGA
ncbi:MAG TPA: 1,4-alpha-glucan branching protein GlgB [Pyrinomonadaceae bacterium]|nr:1,4-alpha-glucan branching protein GlgB [Pyrinomonadaceae bacterium]